MRSRTLRLLCLSLLLALSVSLSADEYAGPPLPAGWYPISEAELTALETTLTQQEQSLLIAQQSLTESQTALTQLRAQSEAQLLIIARLKTSFEKYEVEARRSRWTWGAAGALLGAIAALIVTHIGG